MKKIKALIERRTKLDADIARAVGEHFTIGRALQWERGGNLLLGDVLDTSGERIKVRNLNTGAAYWIQVTDVVREW